MERQELPDEMRLGITAEGMVGGAGMVEMVDLVVVEAMPVRGAESWWR